MEKKQLLHLAKLANLELTPAEMTKQEEVLAQILDYFKKLAELPTTDVEPLTDLHQLKNIYREDHALNPQQQLTKTASPFIENGFFVVEKEGD